MPSIEQDACWYAERATARLFGLEYAEGWRLEENVHKSIGVAKAKVLFAEAFIAGYEHAKKEASAS